jgi:hypothetical protein
MPRIGNGLPSRDPSLAVDEGTRKKGGLTAALQAIFEKNLI